MQGGNISFCLGICWFEVFKTEYPFLPEIDGRGDCGGSLPANSIPTPFAAVGVPEQHDKFSGIAASFESQSDTVEIGCPRDAAECFPEEYCRSAPDFIESPKTDSQSGNRLSFRSFNRCVAVMSESFFSGNENLVVSCRKRKRGKAEGKQDIFHCSLLNFP